MGMKAIECTVVKAHKPEGTSLEANSTPAPTKGTASVKLAGRAERATTIRPKVLEPWAESKV